MPTDDVINWTALKFALDFVATVALFVYFLYSTFIKKKHQDNASGIEAVDQKHDQKHKELDEKYDKSQKELTKKHDALDREVQKLKSSQALLATHEDVAKMRSELNGLSEKVSGIKNILDLLHNHLLNNKGDQR